MSIELKLDLTLSSRSKYNVFSVLSSKNQVLLNFNNT